MEYQKVIDQLIKDQVQPMYFLTGQEDFLQQELLNYLHDSLGSIDNYEQSHFDLNDQSILEVLDEADAFSFFAEYRLIYVNNCQFILSSGNKLTDVEQNRFLEYVDNPNSTSILIFYVGEGKLDQRKKITKALVKKGYIVDFPELNEYQLKKYISQEIQKKSLRMSEEAMEELLERVNFQLTATMNELAKLEMYSQNEAEITKQVVEDLVPRTLVSDVFQLSNAVVEKRYSDAISIYEDLLLLKNEPIALHALMVSQFRLILQSLILNQQGYSQGDIASHLNVHPYRVKLALQSGRHINLKELQGFYLELADIDYQLKTGMGLREAHFYVLLTKLNEMQRKNPR